MKVRQSSLVLSLCVKKANLHTALSWFKDHFLRCNDRTALVKTWLPAQYTGPTTWVDELVYNRALTLVHTLSLPSFYLVSLAGPLFSICRAAQRRARSFLISTSRPMNASACTKSHSGVYTRCRTTCCRRATRSWRKTARRSLRVRPLSYLFSLLNRRSDDLVTASGNRDQADKVTSCALPRADGDANA